MIKGKYIGLRAIEREDLKQLMDWRNNPEFRKYFREHRELNITMQENWFQDKVISDPSTEMFSIVALDNNMQLIGVCGLCHINWIHRNCDLSIYIGYQDLYIDDKYAPNAANVLINHAFNKLNIHRIWKEIYEFDQCKIRLVESLGFKREAEFREHYFYGGKWWNSYIYAVLSQESKSN